MPPIPPHARNVSNGLGSRKSEPSSTMATTSPNAKVILSRVSSKRARSTATSCHCRRALRASA